MDTDPAQPSDSAMPREPETYSPVVDWRWLLGAGVMLVAVCMVVLVAIFAIWRTDQHDENKTLRATVAAQQVQMERLQAQIDQFSAVYDCRTKIGVRVSNAAADWQVAVGDVVFSSLPPADRAEWQAKGAQANDAIKEALAIRAAYEANTNAPCPV